jgi:glycosyltransferase involved in cell wall biosynthesis
MAKVDILIPAYNTARFLPAALASVEAQTFTDWRILLIDDGSTDNTREVIAPFRERMGGKLQYIWKENAGLSAARNTGLSHATAELIALLDADDEWLPERLAESVRSLDESPVAGLSYGFVSRTDTDGRIVSTHDEMKADAEGFITRSIYTRRIDLPCPTITFRRACVDRVGGFDETMRATEDRDLWVRISQHYEVVRIPRVIAYYRISPAAMTSDMERMFTAQRTFAEKHRGTPGCDERAYREAVSSIYRQRAETLGNRRQTWDALRSAAHALALNTASRTNWKTAAAVIWHGLWDRRKRQSGGSTQA